MTTILTAQREVLQEVAAVLIRKERISGDELRAIAASRTDGRQLRRQTAITERRAVLLSSRGSLDPEKDGAGVSTASRGRAPHAQRRVAKRRD